MRLSVAFAPLAVVVLLTPAHADSFLDHARQAVHDASKSVEDAARDAGRSVRDFLTDNPDLNRDVVDFGAKVGEPGFAAAKPATGAMMALAPPEGSPGTALTLIAGGLPGSTDVTVSASAAGDKPTQIATAKTTDRGTLEISLAVPDWAEGRAALVFAVETVDGRVRVVADPFKVTAKTTAAPAVPVVVTGTLSKEGVECPALRGDDGKLYSLTPGSLASFGPGDRVHVEGTVAEISTCMQGITIAVTAITAAK